MRVADRGDRAGTRDVCPGAGSPGAGFPATGVPRKSGRGPPCDHRDVDRRPFPTLPAAPADAQRASAAFAAELRTRIGADGGWWPFDRFMQAVLYEPGRGYYAGGSGQFGAGGDFVTAPETSPLFGACVARQCAQWLEQAAPMIVEFGAGTGALAAQILTELERLGHHDVDYRIVEVSPALAERQRQRIGTLAPGAAARVQWWDHLPEVIDGVIVGNEVLDAMPVRLFRLDGDRVLERGVGAGPSSFEWVDRPAGEAFGATVDAALAASDWPCWRRPRDPQLDYVSEIGEQAAAWIATVGARLRHGAMLLIDYGFAAGEYYHPQRAAGTLMCHYRHHAHPDPLTMPGLQDVTAHVDFTAIAAAARRSGLDLLGYTSQGSFLIDCGLAEQLGQLPLYDASGDGVLARAKLVAGVQRLVSEAEMGELFKVIAFGRSMPDEALGFLRSDRRHALESGMGQRR